jgi:N-acetylglucosamine kinase-like BadF-type ATPase
MPYVLGLDGGGTKSDALLVGEDGTAVAQALGGSTNMQVVGAQKAAETIATLIKDCCAKQGCKSSEIGAVVLGLAGAGRESDRTELLNQLQSVAAAQTIILNNVIIETDARIAIEAAFAGSSGIVVIAGTGSIGLYRTDDQQFHRAGGWGRILGDEGSSYAIARDALAAVMLAYDGRGPQTSLTAKALDYFQVTTPEELITKIYYDKIDIQVFTSRVFRAYDEGDTVAKEILEKNADALVKIVQTLISKGKERKRYPVVLMGGLLDKENAYSKLVKEKMTQSVPNILLMKSKFPTVFGAALMGLNALS